MNTFTSEAMVHALGWVLLHSLWQGALLALLVWVLRFRLPQAKQRYWLAYGALAFMLIAAVVTFFWQYQPEPAGSQPALPTAWAPVGYGAPLPAHSDPVTAGPWMQALRAQLESWHPLIVSVWILGFAVLLIRLAGGWYWLRQLRRRGTSRPEAAWEQVLTRLIGLAGQRQKSVDLLLSTYVRTPMTLGFLKPVILLPVAMVNRISPAEVEAVLAHELAHILRHDWLFNILQALVETLFYYHPAAWWLSSVARQERENSCDDFAVALTGQKIQYAKALLHVQEIAQRAGSPVLALGFAGPARLLRRRPALLHRIQRLLQPQQQKIELMEKWIATAIVLALIALWGIRSGSAPVFSSLQAMVGEPLLWIAPGPDGSQTVASTDSVPKPKRTQKIQRDDGQQKVEMELQDGNITRLNIDGRDIPQSEYGQYKDLTAELLELPDVPAPPATPEPGRPPVAPAPPAPPAPPHGRSSIRTETDDKGNTVIRIEQFGEPVEIVVKDGQVIMNGQPLPEGEITPMPGISPMEFWFDGGFGEHPIAPFAREPFFNEHSLLFAPEVHPEVRIKEELLQRELSKAHRGASEAQLKAFEMQRRAMEKEMAHQRAEIRIQGREMQREQEMALRKAELELQRSHRKMDLELERAQAELERVKTPRPFFKANFNDLLREKLLSDGLITDPREFDFKLSGETLRVNGKKQADNIHREYLEFYRTHTGNHLGAKDEVRIRKEE